LGYLLKITKDDAHAGDHQDDHCGRGGGPAVWAPADGVSGLGGDGGAHHVGGGPDGGGAAADVRAHGQGPGQGGELHAGGPGEAEDHGDHGGGKGDVVHKGAGDGGDPHDDEDHEDGVSAADAADEVSDILQDLGLLQSAHHHEEAQEEEEGLVVDPFEQFPRLLPSGEQGQKGDEGADEGDGEPCLLMGDEQQHSGQEDDTAAKEGTAVGNGLPGVRAGAGQGLAVGLIPAQFLAEAEVEIDHDHHQGDPGDETGVGQKIQEGVIQGGADDDIGRVAAHGRGAAQVGTEDLGEDDGDGVKAQQMGQLHRHRRQEEDDGDAVDEHGQHGGQDHEGDENGHGPIAYRLGQTHAHPAEEARPGHPLHHDHHAGEEENGGPVDPPGALGAASGGIPESRGGHFMETKRIQDRRHTMHRQPKHKDQRGGGTD